MTPSKGQKMSLRISDEERNMIEEFAAKQNMSMSQVIHSALICYLNKQNEVPQSEQTQLEQAKLGKELQSAEIIYNITKLKHDTIKMKIETAKLENEYKQLISDSTEDSNDHTRTL